MSGDYTKFTFDPRKRYTGVWMQQGRVQVDADWNEAVEILKQRVRLLSLDTFGPVGLPQLTTPDAFLIGFLAGPPPDLSIEPGRIYVDGWLAEALETDGATYLTQPFLPEPDPLPADGDAVVYLDVWEREVTYIEDPLIADVALGGADTATRTQMIWQVRVEAREGAECGMDVGEPPSAGRLTTAAFAPPAPNDPCLLPPQSGYRGLENRLYRVEIHDGGALGTARFKWSRDNGSIVSAVRAISVAGAQTTLTVARIGRDQVLRFSIDDWVTITDDHRELHGEPGEMALVVDVNEALSQIVVDRALPGAGRPFGATAADVVARHTRVQLWNQKPATNVLDADGLVATAAGPIDLEDGVQVSFSASPGAGLFRAGDYWVFAARTSDASVEILTEAPPRGIHHRYVQLAAVVGLGTGTVDVFDCRPRPEDEHDRCCCCLVTVGAREDDHADFDTLAGAVAALPNLAPDTNVRVIVCLLEGDHAIAETVRLTRPRLTVRGCGWGTRLMPGGQITLLQMEGAEQVVEALAIEAEQAAALVEVTGADKRIAYCRFENQGPGPAVLAQRVVDLRIERNVIVGSGGAQLAGTRMDVVENRFLGGSVQIMASSHRVRIDENDLHGSLADAISIGGRGVVSDVDISGNRIVEARRNGIASALFDPEQGGATGIVDGLRIVSNEIVDCVASDATRAASQPPFGGIVLGRAYDLVIRDNRIERNGEEAETAVCGIYVRQSRGAEIGRNMIRRNGPRPARGSLPGPQAGIYLADARVGLSAFPDPIDDERLVAEVGIIQAARIADNQVEARRGPALYIRGQGPMSVEGNRFQGNDILGDLQSFTFATVDQYIGTVFIFNAGLPAYLAAFLAGAGLSGVGSTGAVSGTPVQIGLIVGGQTQFRGNQARLDLARLENELVFANVAIISLDDTVISGNQTEGVLSARFTGAGETTNHAPAQFQGDVVLADLFNFALTTRQSHNGLMSTPLLTMFSILSLGAFNHCVENQATSCVRAIGSSPKSAIRDNAVIVPHPLFCADA